MQVDTPLAAVHEQELARIALEGRDEPTRDPIQPEVVVTLIHG
jgi:hypothetical protein